MTTPLRNNQSGITLLITLLLMGVLLGIGATLLNITLKQLQLSSIALESEIAFQAANAGVECALYYDFVDTNHPFDVWGKDQVTGENPEQATEPSITCMGDGPKGASDEGADTDSNSPNTAGNGLAASGEEQRFRFNWPVGNPIRCTEVSVYKFFLKDNGTSNTLPVVLPDGTDMRPGAPCPEGSKCTVIQSRGYNVACSDINTGGRVVEREYTQVY